MAIDPKYTPMFTNVGLTKIANAMANGTKIVLDKFAIGDANATDYTPNATQFALVHELIRIDLRTVWYADFSDGSRTLLEISALIKSGTINGTIREVGIYDAAGDLIIIARTPDRQTITADNMSININYTTQISIANNERVFAVTQAPSGDYVTLFEYNGHVNDFSNPHATTKAQVGLPLAENTADIAKNVLSATKLTTARNINGISFNGTANIDLEDRIGANIASAATTVIGTVGIGDYIKITGVTNIASFGTAGRAGIKRTLIFDNSLSLVHSANLICRGNVNTAVQAGAIVEVIAETTTIWRVVSMSHPLVSMEKIGYLANATSDIQTQMNLKAPLASPALTGTPTAPTATAGTNTTQLANTAFVTTALTAKANTNQTMYIGTTAVAINRTSATIALTGTSISGNAGSASILVTARTINGVSFDGSANITIPTVNSEIIKFDSGINEGTDLYTFNGSSAKTIDIKAGTNVTLSKAAGVITISANDTSIAVTELTGLGANVSTFLATPTSANLKNAVTDETGSGALVFGTSPTLTTPDIGAASASSLVVRQQSVHANLQALGVGSTSGITAPDINIQTTTGYVPMIHQRVLTAAGYRNNTSIGVFRFSGDWSNSGAYIATGGNDNYPTEAFHFRNGAIIESTNGPISLVGNISGRAAVSTTADTFTTARTIGTSGDAVGTAQSFNGSANITIPMTLSNTGVVAGSYSKVTVDAKGRVTAGLIPTMEDIPDATFKRSVKVATTAAITLSGVQTVDGVVLVAGDRVLVKNQAVASGNGIYVVAAAAWTRSLDANTSSKIASAMVAVDSGTVNGGKLFDNDFKTTDALGTTGMSWNMNLDDASLLTSTSTAIGTVKYNGTTSLAGAFDGGTTTPTAVNNRLNYNGYFYPTWINLSGSSDTATASSHVYVETGSDGFVRPKTLANFKSEMFASPALVTPNIGAATALSISSTGYVIGTGTGNDYHTGGLQTQGNGAANTVFPTIGFHQPSLYASSIQLRSGGNFGFYSQGGVAYANVTANVFFGAALNVDVAELTSTSITLATVTTTALPVGNKTTNGSLELTIQATQGVVRQLSKMLITHDGTTPIFSEYGFLNTGATLATYGVAISGNNINLSITGASATSTTYKVMITNLDI